MSRKGKWSDVQGGMAANKLRQILEVLNDEKAYNYAEFGIGLNPKARLCATNLEDLGRLGNCHVGIGSNFAIGGKGPRAESYRCDVQGHHRLF